MPLTEKQITELREELNHCKKPLFFFHDDADGLCSFLLLYRHVKEGKGIPIKSVPKIDDKFVRRVEEYAPDKIFILDVAVVEQSFIDSVKVPVFWLDHHEPLQRENIRVYNPRVYKKDDNTPATYSCYQIVEQDLWIAACGCIGDWFIPPFIDKFKEKYPGLVDKEFKDPGDVLFETQLGKLVNILSFVLKGRTKEVIESVKILTRIDNPYEILRQETPRGKFIFKRYEKINEQYKSLLEKAINKNDDEDILLFNYKENKMSFTGDLSNELLHRFPEKLIIIAREKDDEMRMSLRSRDKLLPPVLEKALTGLEGYGGGHEHACGACVKKKDFKKFVEVLDKEFKNS